MKKLLLSTLAVSATALVISSCAKPRCHVGIERDPHMGRVALSGDNSYWIYEDQFGNRDTVTITYAETQMQDNNYAGDDEYSNDEYLMDLYSTHVAQVDPTEAGRLDRRVYSSDYGREKEVCKSSMDIFSYRSDYPDFFISPSELSYANRQDVTVNGTAYQDAYVITESASVNPDSVDLEINAVTVTLVDGIGVVSWESQGGRQWSLVEYEIKPF